MENIAKNVVKFLILYKNIKLDLNWNIIDEDLRSFVLSRHVDSRYNTIPGYRHNIDFIFKRAIWHHASLKQQKYTDEFLDLLVCYNCLSAEERLSNNMFSVLEVDVASDTINRYPLSKIIANYQTTIKDISANNLYNKLCHAFADKHIIKISDVVPLKPESKLSRSL